MNAKKRLALIMTVIMAMGMSLVVTACGDESADTQEEDQVVVEADGTEPAQEDASEVAETVDEYVALAGEYQDEVSQRASATVVANTESQTVGITVMWSSSASEATMWTMNAEKDGNTLVYSDCVRTELIYSDETDDEGTVDDVDAGEIGGGAEETIVYEGGSGSFEISDGKLLWTGAADADCQGCVFVKVSE